ncbi:MAG TPA: SDR family NAD(P)-dependent oxidoreductase [Lapillicoccus sp.]|nr:SDR family NAD(P)-dependent oxidoreductase [Lapillicoccus sp.]
MGILDGTVAVVTGAARGIGRATIEVFLEEGALVVATDLDGDALDRTTEATGAQPERLVTVVGDVSVEADADAMIEAATRTWGRLDCLVANAGVIPLSTVDQTSVEDWDHVMAVDGRGMFLTCRAALRVMAEQGSGSIVNLSSISGIAGQAGQAAYGPAKFVATGLTRHLAVEWAPRGIRVNAVAPGTIRTDAIDGLLETETGRRYVSQMEGQHPLGRLGEPREVAQAIAFLASDRASFITGEVLAVDGGYLAQ